MSKQYPGGFVVKNPVSPTGSAASGIWTIDQAMQYKKAGAWPGLVGYSAESAALKSTDIKLINPSATTGWYWLKINNTPTQVYIDMDYDGGGWVLVATHPINISIPGLTYVQSTTDTTQLGSSGFVVGSTNPKAYATFSPLDRWTAITTANNAGKNFVYFTAGSQVELGTVASHSRRSRWTWTGWGANYAWQGVAGLTNEVGGTTPGLYSYHIANGYNFSAYDRDQDAYGSNCSSSYGNSPWWYGACWDGNFWGANGGGGYSNAAYWAGYSADYYTYGAMYVK